MHGAVGVIVVGEALVDLTVGAREESGGGLAMTARAGGYLLVATGPWIFGKTVMLPAGVISRIDDEKRVVSSMARRKRLRTRRNIARIFTTTLGIGANSAAITIRLPSLTR